MQIKPLTLAIAALAAAAPPFEEEGLDKRAPLCAGNKVPQCCQLDVLGVADVTCSSRMVLDHVVSWWKFADQNSTQHPVVQRPRKPLRRLARRRRALLCAAPFH